MRRRATERRVAPSTIRWRAGLGLAVLALALAGAGCGGDGDDDGGATVPPPVQTGGADTATQERPATQTETQPADGEDGGGAAAGDAQAGQTVFASTCASCHGTDGAGGGAGPSLQNPQLTDAARVREQVVQGGGGMPAFGDQLNEQEISDVVAYVTQDLAER